VSSQQCGTYTLSGKDPEEQNIDAGEKGGGGRSCMGSRKKQEGLKDIYPVNRPSCRDRLGTHRDSSDAKRFSQIAVRDGVESESIKECHQEGGSSMLNRGALRKETRKKKAFSRKKSANEANGVVLNARNGGRSCGGVGGLAQ